MKSKHTNSIQGVEAVRKYVKQLRDAAGSSEELYKLLYGKEPMANEGQSFRNLLNRGSFPANFVALLVEKLDLKDVTLGEFYGVSCKDHDNTK